MSEQPELLTARLRDERGFTLVEVMVALAIGLVVSTATLAIVMVSVHLGSNYTNRVDANQQGRVAMEKITQALSNGCVTPNQAPVQTGSTATSVSFYSGTNDAPGPTPDLVTISLAATQPAPLIESVQTLQGTAPNWTPTATPPTNFTLALWAAQSGPAGNPTPLFQYYGYDSAGAVSATPFVLTNGVLSQAQALATAMVKISFQALPSNKWSAAHRPVDFTDSVVFRLTPPSSAPNAANLPCT